MEILIFSRSRGLFWRHLGALRGILGLFEASWAEQVVWTLHLTRRSTSEGVRRIVYASRYPPTLPYDPPAQALQYGILRSWEGSWMALGRFPLVSSWAPPAWGPACPAVGCRSVWACPGRSGRVWAGLGRSPLLFLASGRLRQSSLSPSGGLRRTSGAHAANLEAFCIDFDFQQASRSRF